MVLASMALVPLACNLPKSKSFGEDQAAAGRPAAKAGASSGGADDGGTAGQGDTADTGGSSPGGGADTGGSEATGGFAGTHGTADAGGTVATGGTVGAGGTVVGAAGMTGTGGSDGRDAGPDGNTDASITPTEAGTDGVGSDPGAEAGGPTATTGTLLLGNLLPTVETGMFPRSMALGDVNGDGKLDAVTINVGLPPNSVSVQLGRGDGTFGPKMDYEVDYQPQQVALGDLNGDGKLDILAVCYYGSNDVPNVVDVLLGEGDGTFAARKDYATGDEPTFVALGDVDGDGRVDIVTLNGSAETVSVLLGTAQGTLAARVDSPTAAWPASAALGDVNGDGRLDIVTTNAASGFAENGTANALFGNGDGMFAAPVDSEVGAHPTSLALGDVNRDGKLDLVVANQGAGDMVLWSVGVLLGNGDGPTTTRNRASPRAGNRVEWRSRATPRDVPCIPFALRDSFPPACA
jgi:hypothetical protein